MSEMQSPGELLAEARNRAGLSVESVAQDLKMTVTKIKAIEQDNYAPFPADTYLKGYLRNYARLVNLDEIEIIDLYLAFRSDDTAASLESVDEPTSSKRPWLLLLLLIALVVAYVFGLPLWKDYMAQTSSQDAVNASDASVGVIDEADSVEQAQVDAKVESPTEISDEPRLVEDSELAVVVDEPEVDLVLEQNEVPLAAESEESVAVASEAQETVNQYVFTFEDNCWLKVVSNGKQIVAKEFVKGESFNMDGDGPFSVRIGNVNAVTLSQNGEPVTLTPRKNSTVLNLTLSSN